MGGVVACLCVALVGGLVSLTGYLSKTRSLEAFYGIAGRGSFDNGCRILTQTTLPEQCAEGRIGLLIGDSHADALFGSLAREYSERGVRLVSIARGGCNPVWFGPVQRGKNRGHHCSNLLQPLETLLAKDHPPVLAIITANWRETVSHEELTDLVTQFDPARTRVILIGPVPMFRHPSLDCIVLSDRYNGDRARCTILRADVEVAQLQITEQLQTIAATFDHVRYLNPIDVFCDQFICRPLSGNQVLYEDEGHVRPSGADQTWDRFVDDFGWAAGIETRTGVNASD